MPPNFRARRWLKKYLRLTDYLGVAQLYLKDNFLLEKPLQPEHIKERILGHWGTVPGLNLIYAHLNYLIAKHDCEMLLITGPGHGAPAILANLYCEKSLFEFYKTRFPLNKKGMGNIIKDFSWPHSGFPSHVTPGVPGSILEGGELGYSLATAFGAAFDNPNLIVPVICGDGESESGPLAASWNSNKFLNPKTDGAVLPIVHVNGYKISNPTIYGTMSDSELKSLFTGFGYSVKIVEGRRNIHGKLMKAMEDSYQEIRKIQHYARTKDRVLKPHWPVIILKTPKGWKGIHDFKGKHIEGSYRSHGIPIGNPKTDPKAFDAVEKWLKSYKVSELLDDNGVPRADVLEFVPKGKHRMGMNKHAIGGELLKPLKLPDLKKHAVKFKQPGTACASSMEMLGKYLSDVIKKNKKNFRIMCPDELESNKLSAVFEVTDRAYVWPVKKDDASQIGPEGRVMEMLSEHTLNGWLQGYLHTGRHGVFVSYEAFTTIISSMVDQFAKFLKQSEEVKWRKPIANGIYLLSSLGWRQDHNGYSHQNPSFVSNVLQKHARFSQIYYPSDANSLVVAMEEALKNRDGISVIVAGKRPLPQWQTMEQARKQAKYGVACWDWVGGEAAAKNPDVVLASAGDYVTVEALMGARMAQEMCPDLKIRYINVSELNGIALGDYCSKGCRYDLTPKKFEQYFTNDKPVVFNYHGYTTDMQHILWEYAKSDRFSIHGYTEEGSTTTPFDMALCNKVSRYHIAMDLLDQASTVNKKIAQKHKSYMTTLKKKIADHTKYIDTYGDDPAELKDARWVWE